ncbi:DUF4880 domain-containing protein [uncultured Marinobacter sp.]|uniref:FecR family protein n=1 Tax=uncultured Marinobacter sp. TaxID=187379 RepID=UPI0030DDC0C7
MSPSKDEPVSRELLEQQARTWLVKLTSGEATDEDARAFKLWRARSAEHARVFDEMRGLWSALGPALREESASAPISSRRWGRRAFMGAAAASLGYVMLRPVMRGSGVPGFPTDYQTAVGEQTQVSVGDQATVALNTRTRMNLARTGGAPVLDLLAGEAEISSRASGAPLRVRAGGGLIEAGKARFNVRLHERAVWVTCLGERITVTCQGQSSPLIAGQQIRYDDAGLGHPRSVELEPVVAWRQRLLIFDNQLLSEVVAEVNRYRPGQIILMNDAIAARRVQARFSLDQLDAVVALIHDAYGAKVTELPGGVIVLT